MKELLFAELRRFLAWAIGLALAHLVILGFLTRVVDLLQQPVEVYQLFGGVYALAGLLFGLLQMAGHRRFNSWLFLLHRPVPRRNIAAALFGAGGLLVALVVALPVALTIAGQALWSARVVDVRHLLFPIAALLLAGAAYLAGAYAMLSASRFGLLGLVLPGLVVLGAASGIRWLLLLALAVAWLAALAAGAFRADRTTMPRGVLAAAGAAVPNALAVYSLVTVVGGLAVQLGWILLGSHPLNSAPPRGGLVEAQRADGADLFALGLDAAEKQNGASAALAVEREQVKLSEVFTLFPGVQRITERGELTNVAPGEIDDETKNARYTLSHDDGYFHGVDLATRAALPPIGRGGAAGDGGEPFATPPIVVDGYAITASTVAAYDADRGFWRDRLRLPPGETIGSQPARVGESLALLSDRSLLVYEPRRAVSDDAVLVPVLAVPLPAPFGEIARVDLVERLDGWLVSVVVGRGMVDGPGVPFHDVLRVDGAGVVERLVRRPLDHDFPELLWTREFWFSPAAQAVERAALTLLARDNPLEARGPAPQSAFAIGLAIALSLVAAALAARRLRGAPSGKRWSWTIAAALGGLPVLAALWIAREGEATTEPAAQVASVPVTAPAGAGSPFAAGRARSAR